MHALARILAPSLLLASAFVPQLASAQAPPAEQYPVQPGYPQQQAYPQQPGYQQPAYPQQPGYPQQQPQPYPQQYQQPQQYEQPQQYQQPQQYPQQYPPPEQYQQPQQYQQPGYYPQQPGYAPAPQRTPAIRHRGVLFMPYIGASAPVGDGTSGYSTALRLGGLFGFYAGPFLSLNAELSLDILNPYTDVGVSASSALGALTFSPLAHFGPPNVDFVMGPRIGMYSEATTLSYSNGNQDRVYSQSGLAWGFNAGVFFAVGSVWLGGLMSVTLHSASQYCETSSQTAYREECYDVSGGSDFKLLTFNGALLF